MSKDDAITKLLDACDSLLTGGAKDQYRADQATIAALQQRVEELDDILHRALCCINANIVPFDDEYPEPFDHLVEMGKRSAVRARDTRIILRIATEDGKASTEAVENPELLEK